MQNLCFYTIQLLIFCIRHVDSYRVRVPCLLYGKVGRVANLGKICYFSNLSYSRQCLCAEYNNFRKRKYLTYLYLQIAEIPEEPSETSPTIGSIMELKLFKKCVIRNFVVTWLHCKFITLVFKCIDLKFIIFIFKNKSQWHTKKFFFCYAPVSYNTFF